jgi:hypothetical protein
MAAITAAVGLGLAAVGAGVSIYGASQQNEANQAAIAAQQKALAIQQQANSVDADRKRRQLIREGIIARATALSNATNQGAGGSSAVNSAYGQIQGRTGWGIAGVNAALNTSNQLYGANQELFQARLAASEASMYSQIGQGLGSLGGALMSNSSALGNMFGGRGISYGNTLVDNQGFMYNAGAGARYDA